MSFPSITLPLIVLLILAYWLGKRFGWWPSFLPS